MYDLMPIVEKKAKAFFFLPLFCFGFFIVLTSCTEEQQRQAGVMPSSSGSHDEVLVVMNDSTWEGALGDSIRKYFRASYMVLPQPEPIFGVKQTSYDKFKDLFRKFRNVLFVGVLDRNHPTANHIREMLGDKQLKRAKSNQGFYSFIKRNRWAKPQLHCYLFAPDRSTLGKVIHRNHQRFVELFQNSELDKYKSLVYIEGTNNQLTERVQEKFAINLRIPSDYKKAMDKKNFMWLRYDTDEITINLMLSKKPYDNAQFANKGILWRNSLGKKYVESTVKGSYMSTDTILGPISKKTKLNGYEVYENRGLWRMENDFMGGPFLNYYLLDRKHKQMILMDGFVYAPGKDKKKLMRQLEAIFSTFSIQGWQPQKKGNTGS